MEQKHVPVAIRAIILAIVNALLVRQTLPFVTIASRFSRQHAFIVHLAITLVEAAQRAKAAVKLKQVAFFAKQLKSVMLPLMAIISKLIAKINILEKLNHAKFLVQHAANTEHVIHANRDILKLEPVASMIRMF